MVGRRPLREPLWRRRVGYNTTITVFYGRGAAASAYHLGRVRHHGALELRGIDDVHPAHSAVASGALLGLVAVLGAGEEGQRHPARAVEDAAVRRVLVLRRLERVA